MARMQGGCGGVGEGEAAGVGEAVDELAAVVRTMRTEDRAAEQQNSAVGGQGRG